MRPREDGTVALSQAALGYLLTSTGAVVVLLADDLGRRPESLGWLVSTFGVGLLVVGLSGRLLLRADALLVLRVAAGGLAVGAVLLGTAPTLLVAGLGGAVLGLSGAAVVLVTPVLVAGPKSPSRLQRVNAAASAASVAAPLLLGGVALAGGGGRLALLVAVPPLVALAVRRGPSASPTAGAGQQRGSDQLESAFTTADRGGVAAAWTPIVMAVSVEFCFVVWGASLLQDTGLTSGSAAATAATFPLGLAVGRVLAGWRARAAPVAAASVVVALGSLLTTAAQAPAPAAAGLLVAGLGVAPLYPATLAALVSRPDLRPGDGAALGALASGTAVLLAPAGLGLLGEQVGLRLALLAVLPLLAALLLARCRGEQVDADGEARVTSAPGIAC